MCSRLKASGVCDSASKVDQNWFDKRIAKSSNQSRRQSSRLERAKRLSGGGQSLKLSTKAAVFKRVSLLIGGPSISIGGRPPWPSLAPALVQIFDMLEL